MEPLHMLMDKYYEQYRNRWHGDDNEFQISDLYSYVETVVPILTNNRTRANVKAEYPDYLKHADGMRFILDHAYDTNNWDYKAQRIARMAEIYRSALAYTGYDEKANNGTGKLTIEEINPRWCYMDPAVTELEDSAFFIYAEPMRASKVKKMYPKKAKEIDESKDKGTFTGENKVNWWKSWLRQITNTFTNFVDKTMTRYNDTMLPELDEAEKRKNAVAFIHYWYRDDDDKWRVAYFADDVFLEDRENPFWHEKLPYDIYSPTEDILSALGIPMGEHIENLNFEKNVLLTTIIEHAKKSVNPPRVFNTSVYTGDKRDLVDGGNDNIIGIPNPDYIPMNAIFADLYPAPMPAFVNELPERFDSFIDKITGVNDSFRGMSEASSGKEVQLKQEAAYTRIKTKVDNFEKFVKCMSEKIIVNAMQFINTDTTFRVKGDYRQFEDVEDTPFEVEPIPTRPNAEGQMEYDKNEFFLYANPNEWTKLTGKGTHTMPDGTEMENSEMPAESHEKTEEGVKEAIRILQFTVEIEAGSSLATSRIAQREEALELFSAGAIDQQALLEVWDFPNYDEILQRMQEQAQLQAEREMMMAQQTQSAIQQPPQQPQGQVDIASYLNQLRQMFPEMANMTDEEIMQVLASMNQPAPM
ncbi:portal protein [Bacillus oleivorans]|nr:hypothetical protein [Bacillus oleivorans]